MDCVNSLYTSCACNRSPSCLDWGKNGYIIYGACHAVAVYKPEPQHGGKVVQSLIGHKGLVTSVHWVRKKNGLEHEFVSTSADQSAIIWCLKKDEFSVSHTLSGHSAIVRIASSIYLNGDDDPLLLIATASADSSVKLWKRGSDNVQCVQTISFGNGFALDVKFALLEACSSKDPLLAIARDDAKIHLYVLNAAMEFAVCTVLSGHEDWVQSIDFLKGDNYVLWLASGSQDSFVRIWKITNEGNDGSSDNDNDESSDNDNDEASDNDNDKSTNNRNILEVKKNEFSTHSEEIYSVSLYSVLCGHDNWVYSVRWGPHKSTETDSDKSFKLLSTSMDKTMVIWQPDYSADLWLEAARVGEIGGNTLGLYGGVFSPDEDTFVGHGYQGAIHVWSFNKELDVWEPGIPFGGHFASVQDIDWDPEGAYLLSCSHDQTTRLHAPLYASGNKEYWYELARPQIHGYDMVCLSVLNRYAFVSAGDEKVLRVFEAPKSFAENMKNLCNIDTSSYVKDSLPEGASVPALGLSNKAVFDKDIERAKKSEDEPKHVKDRYPDFYYTPTVLTGPPPEEILLQNTLWPEDKKLYGHPYEVFSVTTNHSKTIVASSCKASKAEHAAIILWDAQTWKKLGTLVFHTLSITQMEFSPDDNYLLSVSRDRMWALYKHFPDETPPYRKAAHLDKKLGVHARIIWSCSWSHDSLFFATSSRDKKVALWSKNPVADSLIGDVQFTHAATLAVEESATAVSFAPSTYANGSYVLAVGLENGHILIRTWKPSSTDGGAWNIVCDMDSTYAHHLTVNRLKFCPIKVSSDDTDTLDSFLLASCGSDSHVRINAIKFLSTM